MEKALHIITYCFFIVMLYIFFAGFYPFRSHYEFIYKPYTQTIDFEYNLDCPYTNNEIKDKLSDIVGEHIYIYSEVNLPTSIGGQTIFLARIIQMNSIYLQFQDQYTWSLAHELVHLKYFTANECFTEYTAIIALYESGDEYFVNVAKWAAEKTVKAHNGSAYDCGYYLLEYFKE